MERTTKVRILNEWTDCYQAAVPVVTRKRKRKKKKEEKKRERLCLCVSESSDSVPQKSFPSFLPTHLSSIGHLYWLFLDLIVPLSLSIKIFSLSLF